MKWSLIILILFVTGCTAQSICSINGVEAVYKCKDSTNNHRGLYKIVLESEMYSEYIVINEGYKETAKKCYIPYEDSVIPEWCLVTCDERNLC